MMAELLSSAVVVVLVLAFGLAVHFGVIGLFAAASWFLRFFNAARVPRDVSRTGVTRHD